MNVNYYQVSLGLSYTGPTSAQTYVEADSYAEAFAKAHRLCDTNERVQRVEYLEPVCTDDQPLAIDLF